MTFDIPRPKEPSNGTPGHPTADRVFHFILRGTAAAHGVTRDMPDDELRRALAALSVFRGPGTFARDFSIQVIRDELTRREGGQ